MTRPVPTDAQVRNTLNWSWIKRRIRHTLHCRGPWETSHFRNFQACARCGVWRWHPIHPGRAR